MEARNLETAAEVCDKLGISEIARLTGRKYSAAHNWKGFGKFPADTFLVLQEALARIDCTAPATLWSMVESPSPNPNAAHTSPVEAA